jgi:hypothetical protein
VAHLQVEAADHGVDGDGHIVVSVHHKVLAVALVVPAPPQRTVRHAWLKERRGWIDPRFLCQYREEGSVADMVLTQAGFKRKFASI